VLGDMAVVTWIARVEGPQWQAIVAILGGFAVHCHLKNWLSPRTRKVQDVGCGMRVWENVC
jgi:hypothetical protein